MRSSRGRMWRRRRRTRKRMRRRRRRRRRRRSSRRRRSDDHDNDHERDDLMVTMITMIHLAALLCGPSRSVSQASFRQGSVQQCEPFAFFIMGSSEIDG
eukprot:8430186-Karenia_brevis.AAC.1